MKNIIENINYYKARSADKLSSQQVSYVPYLEPDQIECTVSTYHMSGRRIPINQTKQICFKLRYIKFKPIHYRIKNRYLNSNTSMIELVDGGIIRPFALFVNGLFIPWDIISISICPESAYLIVDLSDEFIHLAMDIKYAQILSLPDYIKYNKEELNSNSLYRIIFSFNKEGKYDMESSAYSFIISGDPHVCMCALNTNGRVNALNVLDYMHDENGNSPDLSYIKFVKENVILFVNGLISIGTKENIKRAIDWDYIEGESSDYSPRLEIQQSSEDLGSNPIIRFNSTLLTINDSLNDNNDVYDIVVCANADYTNTIDNIANTQTSYIQAVVQNINDGDNPPAYFEELDTEFSMIMDKYKDYSTNIADCIKTMIKYNTNSFNETIRRNSNLEIMEYSGEWVMANMDNDEGILCIPRRHSDMEEEFIIMLVNGELYKYDHMIKHIANYCIIPVADISYDDKIEIMRFKNVNNLVTDLLIGEDDGFVYYSPDMINETMVLFSNEPLPTDPYTYPYDGQQYFPVDYTLETDDKGLIKISLTEPFYYGRKLKVAYKNRYSHAQYIIPSSDYLQYCIDLNENFSYCYDYSKYIIFHNGRKLDSSFYRIVLPVRNTTPFYEFKLYFSIPVVEGDRIDVVYSPSLMKDIVCIPQTEISGNIEIDKNVLNYGLGSELYMVWINGKKIPASCIKDIDSNRLYILSDEQSIYNLCITKYIPDVDMLLEDFKNIEKSTWDKVISELSETELYALLGINPAGLSNNEVNITEGAVDIRSVMYELIREQYVMNPRVDITERFVYGYQDIDDSIVDEVADDGTILLPVADANRQDNLDNVNRVYP